MNTPNGQTASESPSAETKFAKIAAAACARLAKNERVRRTLPGEGRLKFDRQLPFLCVYRSPIDRDDKGTRELVTTEAAYLFASAAPQYHPGLSKLFAAIYTAMQEHFGTFLLIEVWSMDERESDLNSRPAFEIVTPELDSLPSTLEVLQRALSEITVYGHPSLVSSRYAASVAPFGTDPIVPTDLENASAGCCTIGLAVNPIYRDRKSGSVYPMVLQILRRQLATAFRKAIAEFTGTKNKTRKLHYETFGPSSLVKTCRLIDQQLCEVSESFDFLLQVTPTNTDELWEQFQASGYRELAPLRYRPLPYHPNRLKRQLFEIEIERVEDATLAYLFSEKQDEIDRQLTALRDLSMPALTTAHVQPSNFLTTSLQLYGRPEDSLVELADTILHTIATLPARSEKITAAAEQTEIGEEADCISATELVAQARDEIDYYHTKMNEFSATVEVSDSIAAGIMVSQDRLLIDRNLRISPQRVEALLHHEIGTHLLTYFNGRCQPFRQLYAGLAGYEELQEGLAVLAEYLCGGLTHGRLRTLAARVLAVDSMAQGNSFAATFDLLHHTHQFPPPRAFKTALRVYRGGGFSKDLIYLRGLRDLLDYLDSGHEIDPLYVGKIGLQHVPYIQEMRRREIITPPRILPRFRNDTRIRNRLKSCRGKSVLNLLEIDE